MTSLRAPRRRVVFAAAAASLGAVPIAASCRPAPPSAATPRVSPQTADPGAASVADGAAAPPFPRIETLRVTQGGICVALGSGRARCADGYFSGDEDGGWRGRDSTYDFHPVGAGHRPPPAWPLGEGERAVDFGIDGANWCVVLASGEVRCRKRPCDTGDSGARHDGGVDPHVAHAPRLHLPCDADAGAIVSVDLGPGAHAVHIASGGGHACVLLDSGCVECWGLNQYGQLGLGDRTPRPGGPRATDAGLSCLDLGHGRMARAISAGHDFSCALLDDGNVKCWGRGEYLGLGADSDRGSAPGQMGEALPAVDLGSHATAIALASGPRTTCVILGTGSVKCWGAGTGAIGSCEPLVTGDRPREMGDSLAAVDLGTHRTARAIAVSMDAACAILEDGSLKCWGSNTNGELAVGDDRPHGCGGMGDALPAYDFGPGRTVRQVGVGSYPCVVLDDDELKCWTWKGPRGEPALDVGD